MNGRDDLPGDPIEADHGLLQPPTVAASGLTSGGPFVKLMP